MLPDSAVTDQVEPLAEAYCTDQPDSDTVAVPWLYSSMKSLRYCAPVLPPPPYTSLIVTSAETAPAVPGASASSAPVTATVLETARTVRRSCRGIRCPPTR